MRNPSPLADWRTYDLAQHAKWLFSGVILLAILLRVWGVNFGLPYLYHPDEPGYVTIAQKIFKTGDLNPHFFNFPSLLFYVSAAAYVPYYLVGKAVAIFDSPADIPFPMLVGPSAGQTTMPSTFLLGRMLSVAFGSAAVALTLLIGWRLSGKIGVILLAGVMMALSPTHLANRLRFRTFKDGGYEVRIVRVARP